ncbi:MAG TPA: hypothetical protein VI391_07910 [Thermoanaerobaculia bacterium]
MKKLLVLICALCGVSPLAASGQMTGHHPAPTTIVNETFQPAFIMPAMGRIAGSAGVFRSSMQVCNDRQLAQDIDVYWYPSGSSGSASTPVTTISMPATYCSYWDDFVSTVLNTSGLGTAEFVGVFTGTHVRDTGAMIEGYSRIWSVQGSTGGTMSQSFDSVAENFLATNSTAMIRGVRQDAQFHSNIGIANISPVERTFAVHIYGSSSAPPAPQGDFTVTVPAYSLVQTPIPAGVWNVANLYITPQGTGTGQWVAYGSSVDNTTGDAWSNNAFRY